MKNSKTTGNLVTTIITNEDNTKTFEIKREFKGAEGNDIILLQLFPTLGQGNEFDMDSTAKHIVAHRKELGIKSIRFINLFAKRCSVKLSTRGLRPDEENIRYIESVFKEKNTAESKFVVAYGCTMSRCRAANLTKKMIFDLYRNYCPDNRVYQITTEYLDAENSDGVHVLYLGIRHCNETWRLEEYKIPDFDRILLLSSGKGKKEKSLKDGADRNAGENTDRNSSEFDDEDDNDSDNDLADNESDNKTDKNNVFGNGGNNVNNRNNVNNNRNQNNSDGDNNGNGNMNDSEENIRMEEWEEKDRVQKSGKAVRSNGRRKVVNVKG